MRITGGQRKGQILASPRGLETRPTSDRVREAIFNIIGHDLCGVKVLDLFAGTGSLGLETLSRGASQAVFIDNSRQCVKLIKKNLALCGYEDAGVVLRRDLRKGFRRIQHMLKGLLDLVFIDPPYGKGFISLMLSELSTMAVLSDKSRIVAESSKSEKLPLSVGTVEMIEDRSYGDTKVSFYAYGAGK